jgi:hypothetical protein
MYLSQDRLHDDDDDDDDYDYYDCTALHALCLAYNIVISQKHSSITLAY